MPILSSPGALRRFLLSILLLTATPVALAQSPADAPGASLSPDNDPAELLARALRTLQAEPRNLQALTTAGHNALVLGDTNAAVGFFGRAQEIAPRDGRVKAGLGSALVQMEKPQDALRLFADASRLGVPDVEFAADRGLAYDLTGDPRRAQHDYALELGAHPDDDITRRRLALSQGISGDKTAALATLDPLVRKKDIAAWRAQTFILAMTGDTRGAQDITRVMLPQQSVTMQPFLERLSGLSAADKARAVHFGEMPSAGHSYTSTELANIGTPPTYAPAPRSDLAPMAPSRSASGATQLAQAPAAPSLSSEAGLPSPAQAGHYDLPHVAADKRTGRALNPTGTRTIGTPVFHSRTAADEEYTSSTHSKASARSDSNSAETDEDCVTVKTTAKSSRSGRHHHKGKPATKVVCKAHHGRADDEVGGKSARGSSHKSGADEGEDCARVKTTTKGSRHHKGKTTTKLVCKKSGEDAVSSKAKGKSASADDGDEVKTKGSRGKASGANEDCTTVKTTAKGSRHHKGKATTKVVCKKSDDESDGSTKSSKKGAASKASVSNDTDDNSTKSKTGHGKSAKVTGEASDDMSFKAEKGSHYYVQVAGGARKADMDKAWAGVKKKAPELMKGKMPSTTPLRATHRLMVGPFKDEDEAQSFVNKMAGKGMSGFVVRTARNQKVEKIDSDQ